MLRTGPAKVGLEDKSLWVVFLGASGCLHLEWGQKATAELGDEQMGSLPGKERAMEGSAPPAKHLTKITIKFFMVIFLEASRAREKEKQTAEKRKKKIIWNWKVCPRKKAVASQEAIQFAL